MTSDSETPIADNKNSQSKKTKKIRKSKGKREYNQASGSAHGSEQELVSGDLPEHFDRLNVGPGADTQARKIENKKPSQSKEAEFDDLAAKAFDAEEAEFAKKSQSRRAKNKCAEDSLAELEKLGLSLKNPPPALCLRPQFPNGTKGKKVKLYSNFFKLSLGGKPVYQYLVTFLKPDQSSADEFEQEVGRKFKRIAKKLNQTFLAQFINTTGKEIFVGVSYAYDNDRILITSKPLPDISKEGRIFTLTINEPRENDPDYSQRYLIRIKPTVRVCLSLNEDSKEAQITHDRAILQVIDIICKTYSFQNDIIYGSKIFFLASNMHRREDISKRFELAFGYHQSTRLCQEGPMLNIDRATAVLYKEGPLIRSMCEVLGVESPKDINLTPSSHHALEELTFLRVETEYRKYRCKHTIQSFTVEPCSCLTFQQGNSTVYVADYFREHYNIHLEYPFLPCIVYGSNNYIPVELCSLLPNQRNQRKLRDELISIVSKHTTAQRPMERLCELRERANDVSNQLRDNQFDIQLNPTQVIVESRVIPAPRLTYANDKESEPRLGNWNMKKVDNSSRRLLSTVELKRWALIGYPGMSRRIDSQIAENFIKLLQKNGSMVGMEIASPVNPFKVYKANEITGFFKFCVTRKLQLIIVIMEDNVEHYGRVKYLGDKCLGVPTQVVLDKHYDHREYMETGTTKLFKTAYLSNLLLKINVKIGGANLKLSETTRCSILNDKTMVVGIDVNHPSPGENARSIAAVVGSIDKEFSKYRTEIFANHERDELVQVHSMIGPIIDKFKSSRGFYPEHIIIYRDGVSEGQFAHVMGSEILPLHKRLEEYSDPPKLTYIIVQKRHNARFFPVDSRDGTGNGNMLPGSVIDTNVCHFKWFDFYLCSQNSFLGTARPGKYTVLWNSSSAQADDLQMATYYLCYLFARATKSIADPAPARYAHHAAARGKFHYREICKRRQWTDEEMNAEINRAINVNENFKNILYFI
ncbi:protein argonaute-3-like [Panonychus citri]|uniref:protein argonaute-3-like n=1 Tax=Panonychus citri TaxID=50023 RepID=UPI0023070F84|nr:protein argonaute-3-like [Panonychus citri]